MKLNILKPQQIEAKTLLIYMKVRDEFCADLKDNNGESLRDYEGYVPEFMPDHEVGGSGTNMGDYLILEIEIDTGLILNWKKPTSQQLEAFVASQEEE